MAPTAWHECQARQVSVVFALPEQEPSFHLCRVSGAQLATAGSRARRAGSRVVHLHVVRELVQEFHVDSFPEHVEILGGTWIVLVVKAASLATDTNFRGAPHGGDM
ncbi:unnamed protein product [Peronospora farinosa]|uniref:Uncharacterized protein n=1 Tax=Peronospora farinosa TaxID=134698 RepID=A0AAV0SW83_9STRA|nr:unnamed protein product [Peronospora farinosa]